MTLTDLLAALKTLHPLIDWLDHLPMLHASKLAPALDWLDSFSDNPQAALAALKSTKTGAAIVAALELVIPWLEAAAKTTPTPLDDKLVAWLKLAVCDPEAAVKEVGG